MNVFSKWGGKEDGQKTARALVEALSVNVNRIIGLEGSTQRGGALAVGADEPPPVASTAEEPPSSKEQMTEEGSAMPLPPATAAEATPPSPSVAPSQDDEQVEERLAQVKSLLEGEVGKAPTDAEIAQGKELAYQLLRPMAILEAPLATVAGGHQTSARRRSLGRS